MSLIGHHLSRLADFNGRENRKPFWLWILLIYIAQIVIGIVASTVWMSHWFTTMQPMTSYSQSYLDEHPEIVAQFMQQVMAPMMRSMMIVVAASMVVVAALIGAAVVRRLHDGGRSGWWAAPVFALQIAMPLVYAAIFPQIFANFGAIHPGMEVDQMNVAMGPAMQSMAWISVAGMIGFLITILLIVFLALPGTEGRNRYGEDPLLRR